MASIPNHGMGDNLTFGVGVRQSSKHNLIRHFAYSMFHDKYEYDKIEIIANHILERELVLSTGIGSGYAIPHGAVDFLPSLHMGLFYAAEAIEWDSLDKAPVWVFLCIVGPKADAGTHVKAITRFSRICRRGLLEPLSEPPSTEAEWERRFATAMEHAGFRSFWGRQD